MIDKIIRNEKEEVKNIQRTIYEKYCVKKYW